MATFRSRPGTPDLDMIAHRPRTGQRECNSEAVRPGAHQLRPRRVGDPTRRVTGLLVRTERGDGPRTMSEMIDAASSVVEARHADQDPAALHRWLSENAETLVGQQIFVTAVHSQRSPSVDLPRVCSGSGHHRVTVLRLLRPSSGSRRNT